MIAADAFSQYYAEFLDETYDVVDRIVAFAHGGDSFTTAAMTNWTTCTCCGSLGASRAVYVAGPESTTFRSSTAKLVSASTTSRSDTFQAIRASPGSSQ